MRVSILKWKLKHCAKLLAICLLSILFINILLMTYQYGEQKTKMTNSILSALGSRDVKEIVKFSEDTTIIKGWSDPLPSDNAKGPLMIILVTSLAENEDRRTVIRNTWAKKNHNHNFDTHIRFFTGKPKNGDLSKLMEEAANYGDLIVDDLEESYFGLTIKTLRMLKWFLWNCPRAEFLVKVDDDVFVNVDNLILHLHGLDPKEKLKYLGGVVHSGRSPHTLNPYSKWYVPPEIWEPHQQNQSSDIYSSYSEYNGGYPPYCEGNFYVISGQLVPLLLNASLSIPLFHLEDIYLTGLVASSSLKIELKSIPRVFSASAMWPKLNYFVLSLFQSWDDIIAYHCDNQIDLIEMLYNSSLHL